MLRPLHEAEELAQLLKHNIIATISSLADAQALESMAAQLEQSGQAHLKFDTGMGRYGFLPEELDQLRAVLDNLQHIAITGVYTHFSCAFCSRQKTEAQYRLFRSMIDTLTEQGYCLGETHCSNSSALFRYPQLQADSVRIGSAFLGRLPFAHHTNLQRVGYAEAPVEEIRQLPAGTTIGYGASYRTNKPTTIAVLSIGWYHGFGMERGRDSFRLRDTLRNSLSLIKAWLSRRRVYVRLGEQLCPVLGHVGMLHTIVDVSGLDVQVGDVARLEISPLDCKALPIVYR